MAVENLSDPVVPYQTREYAVEHGIVINPEAEDGSTSDSVSVRSSSPGNTQRDSDGDRENDGSSARGSDDPPGDPGLPDGGDGAVDADPATDPDDDAGDPSDDEGDVEGPVDSEVDDSGDDEGSAPIDGSGGDNSPDAGVDGDPGDDALEGPFRRITIFEDEEVDVEVIGDPMAIINSGSGRKFYDYRHYDWDKETWERILTEGQFPEREDACTSLIGAYLVALKAKQDHEPKIFPSEFQKLRAQAQQCIDYFEGLKSALRYVKWYCSAPLGSYISDSGWASDLCFSPKTFRAYTANTSHEKKSKQTKEERGRKRNNMGKMARDKKSRRKAKGKRL